jgi:putative hydrolase of the HAD superfamily
VSITIHDPVGSKPFIRSERARRAVLFDAAGTLIDPREPIGDTYARIAEKYGAAISAWRLDDAFARVWRAAPAMVYPGLPGDASSRSERDAWRAIVRQTFLAADSAIRPSDFDACFEELFAHFATGSAWRERPGAREVLAALREADVATGVISNFDRRLRGILADLELAPLLDLIWLPSDAGVAKPDPAIFTSALSALGVTAERALFVGNDAERDLEAARAAGLRPVDVASLATLADLPALLERELPEEPHR